MPGHPDVAKGITPEQDNRMVRKEADSSGESATAHTTHETCLKAPMGLNYEGRRNTLTTTHAYKYA